MIGVSCGQSRVDGTLSLAQRRVGTGLEREKGFEPVTACLEGISLYTVWQPEWPGERKLSSYHLVKWCYPALFQNLIDVPCDHLGLKGGYESLDHRLMAI